MQARPDIHSSPRRRSGRWAGPAGAVAVTALAFTGLAAAPAAAATACSLAPTPVYGAAKPSSGSALYTVNATENASAAGYGFTENLGTAFTASAGATSTLTTPVRRLYRPATGDFVYIADNAERSQALALGYADYGVNFYASMTQTGCLVPVNRYYKNGFHRFASTSVLKNSLSASGWQNEGVMFYGGPSSDDTALNAGGGGLAAAAPAADTVAAAEPVADITPAPSSSSAGSVPVGQASYPVPGGAIFVSPGGSDTNSGSQSAPVRTIARAVALAPSAGTVVLRGGRYNENVTITKQVTIQNYPGEAAWMDGSIPVSNWTASGTQWTASWNKRFDASPTFVAGAADSSDAFYQWLRADYPMAAHPDQVFVDGTQLKQVSSASKVTASSFYYDEAASRLVLGVNPSGHTVEATSTSKALTIRGAGTTIRGIGIRRFATSVPQMGAVTVEAPNVTLENVVLLDIATDGVSTLSSNTRFSKVTAQSCGLLGFHANLARDVTFDSVKATLNNSENFNIAPVSGGAKISRTRGVVVKNSDFSGNNGPGFWADMSVYSGTLNNNTFNDNVGDGVFLEISSTFKVVDNFMLRNGDNGIMVNNTNNVQLWNNTIIGSGGRPVEIAQDTRRNTNPNDPAVDTSVPWPDPNMPWTLGPVTVRNNIISDSGGNCLMCVEDYSRQKSAEQLGISTNSDIYHRSSAGTPTWLTTWSRANINVNPYVFNTLADVQRAVGQESLGREYSGAAIVSPDGSLSSSVQAQASSVATGLPSDIAQLAGQGAGTKYLGAWR